MDPDRPRPPSGDTAAPWRAAVRDVGVAAALVVGVVLGAAALTGVLPVEVQRLIFHTPLAIFVLVGGTAWVLWRSARS